MSRTVISLQAFRTIQGGRVRDFHDAIRWIRPAHDLYFNASSMGPPFCRAVDFRGTTTGWELIREHSGTEQSVLSSGYRYRQIFEVVQNAADAILEAADAGEDGGRILVRVANSHLYVGNTGAPLSKDGIIALLGANSSRKRKSQIGRFGLGFKSLLALDGTIDLFSRSVSIRFDPEACQRAISEELELPPDEMAPSLRMAEVISYESEARRDEHLGELGSWATTILRAEKCAADTTWRWRVLRRMTISTVPRRYTVARPDA
jgi:hypothetical protein